MKYDIIDMILYPVVNKLINNGYDTTNITIKDIIGTLKEEKLEWVYDESVVKDISKIDWIMIIKMCANLLKNKGKKCSFEKINVYNFKTEIVITIPKNEREDQ